MNLSRSRSLLPAAALLAVGITAAAAGAAFAHCDTLGGPVVADARLALERGDVTPVLKWVRPADEAEVRAVFAEALAVRALGPRARELADRHFFETLVRVHRAGEGAPYTGLKDASAEPIIAMADEALATGSSAEMIRAIGAHMSAAIEDRFARAVEARRTKDESVAAGREYVEAYVTYTHFVEAVHDAIATPGGHAHAGHE